ncbi:plasmid partition protein ParG [Candidatus Sororendozoicomonas aggregata]|uniref:plasmid partition protein ParG n=1 Tax=Candidatus Sororendozoicomonas aggregata TaxID=3073239 RepID=UPI002ED00B51
MTKNLVQVRFQVEEQLRNEFKAACAKSGKSQAEVMREFMSRFVNGDIDLKNQ